MADEPRRFTPEEIEKGQEVTEYYGLSPEEGGPQPSDGREMETIVIKDIIESKQKQQDGE